MELTEEIKLELKLVGSITGEFFVPSYQRGYRWGKDEVNRLLDDILANGKDGYCLQPIVVKKREDKYELIDGQQRLTTIYLIYKYMREKGGQFMPDAKFSLTYDTREKSETFLREIDFSMREDNIDFWFICQAYEEIDNWFTKQNSLSAFLEISSYFEKKVKIIWYETGNGSDEDSIALFTRLNIGKIPLTSAELVKAMFLSRNNKTMTYERQQEISLQWDNMERELHNESFWYFLTNYTPSEMYQTRIDLVLDLIAQKPSRLKDDNFTFFEFDAMRKRENDDFIGIWNKIQHTFSVLKDWYENHTFYHKIGYLIASETMSLLELYQLAEGKTKSQFAKLLDDAIKKSIAGDDNYADLSYERADDYRKISTLLLLFNVESVRIIDDEAQRFPFDKFKVQKGNASWSLEHIHAQQSEGMKTQAVWKDWLEKHKQSLCSLPGYEDLVAQIEEACKKPNLKGGEFETLRKKIAEVLSAPGSVEYLHSISNLALLNTTDNAALNNAAFDVKRNEIIEMDKRGQYIPFCTKMVFLKYYTDSKDNQVHFWGPADRIAYINGINRVLAPYLEECIRVEKEVEIQ